MDNETEIFRELAPLVRVFAYARSRFARPAGLPLGSAIGGWLVTHSLSAALIFAAMASAVAAMATFLLIPPSHHR